MAATNLDCSVGIGKNKLPTKISTGFRKSAGVFGSPLRPGSTCLATEQCEDSCGSESRGQKCPYRVK